MTNWQTRKLLTWIGYVHPWRQTYDVTSYISSRAVTRCCMVVWKIPSNCHNCAGDPRNCYTKQQLKGGKLAVYRSYPLLAVYKSYPLLAVYKSYPLLAVYRSYPLLAVYRSYPLLKWTPRAYYSIETALLSKAFFALTAISFSRTPSNFTCRKHARKTYF